jgi:hypothetical protein
LSVVTGIHGQIEQIAIRHLSGNSAENGASQRVSRKSLIEIAPQPCQGGMVNGSQNHGKTL